MLPSQKEVRQDSGAFRLQGEGGGHGDGPRNSSDRGVAAPPSGQLRSSPPDFDGAVRTNGLAKRRAAPVPTELAGPSPLPAGEPSPKPDRVPTGLRVLAADGDPSMSLLYQQLLSGLGHQVFVVRTGKELVETCRLLRPDLVLAELALPDQEGAAAADVICRERPVPVILVSGGRAVPDGRSLDNPSVLAYLVKPLKESFLGATVAMAWSRFEQMQALTRQAAELRQALEDRKLIERAKGMVMRYAGLGEEEAYQRLKKMACDQNRKLGEVAQTVLAAGKIFHEMDPAPPNGKPDDERRRPSKRG